MRLPSHCIPQDLSTKNKNTAKLVITLLPSKVIIVEKILWLKHGFQEQPSGSNVFVFKVIISADLSVGCCNNFASVKFDSLRGRPY